MKNTLLAKLTKTTLPGLILACGIACNAIAGFVAYRPHMDLSLGGVNLANQTIEFKGRLTYMAKQGRTGIPAAPVKMTIKRYGANYSVAYLGTVITKNDGTFTWQVPRSKVPPASSSVHTHYVCNAYFEGSTPQGNYQVFGTAGESINIYVEPNGSVH